MKRHRPLLSLVELCLVLALIHASAVAQTAAQFNGRVTDANDAVVAGAKMRVSHAATGITRTATANSEGYYVVP